jgi:hypothetical protein
MKPFRYYKSDWQKFAPCHVDATYEEVSVKLHPAIQGIRSKRKRMREIKKLTRIGIKLFCRDAYIITPI